MALSFGTAFGAIYTVQSRTNFFEGSWKSEPTPITGTGDLLTFHPGSDGTAQRFFRILAR